MVMKYSICMEYECTEWTKLASAQDFNMNLIFDFNMNLIFLNFPKHAWMEKKDGKLVVKSFRELLTESFY